MKTICKLSIRRIGIMLISFIMITALFNACSKDEESTTQTATGTIKVTSAARTSAKTAAATAASAAVSSVKTASVSATAAAITDSGSAETASAGTEDDGDTQITEDEIDFSIQEKLGEELNFDLGGRTVTYYTDSAGNVWSDAETMRIDFRVIYRRLKEAEGKYNFKFEAKQIVKNFYTELVNQTLAGVKYCDIIQFTVTQGGFPTYVNNNIVYCLDDYIDFEKPILKANSVLNTLTWKGKHYSITSIYDYAFANVMYNRDLLSREGITDILDLVEINQWTWVEFLDIAQKCTKDTDGNGLIDQWGIVQRDQPSFCKQILGSNGQLVLRYDASKDKYVYNLDSSASLRALQFISELTFVHNVSINDKTSNVPTYKQGRGAMYVDQYWYNPNMLKAGINSGLAPLPTGPDVNNYQNIDQPGSWAILSTCDKPREISQLLMEAMILWDEDLNMAPDYAALMESKGGESWLWNPDNTARRISTQREYEQVFKRLYPLFTPDLTGGWPNLNNTINKEVYTNITSGLKGVAEAVDSVKPFVESTLDEYDR